MKSFFKAFEICMNTVKVNFINVFKSRTQSVDAFNDKPYGIFYVRCNLHYFPGHPLSMSQSVLTFVFNYIGNLRRCNLCYRTVIRLLCPVISWDARHGTSVWLVPS